MLSTQAHASLLQIPTHLPPFLRRHRPPKQNVVVVMGATGTGKSKLAVDLAAGRHHPAEIINSDKMQVYEGLDIVTNKITPEECLGIPHHLIGIADSDSDFTAADFAATSSLAVESISEKGKLPIIAGGSNSFIEALIDGRNHEFRSRYDVCFLWVDVAMPVLHRAVSLRVDRMVAAGMVEEVRQKFDLNSSYSRGIRQAIGVPEFDSFFRSEFYNSDRKTRAKLLESAINETKVNTCKLACKQLRKIHRLRNVNGWKIHRLDATKVFEKTGSEADEAWRELVAEPGSAIVARFIHGLDHSWAATSDSGWSVREAERRTAMVAAAR
ncbi:hypothetical protein OSB04_022911 [Centaurea solstitialis]|uniref:adenylate dimethylallyltransferase (ADP/ATP-dependent) n=1 Tax=Centaurea solstitialis TaxID=347529 RepID=A0AA38SJT3_9ASTR|nr:hypothetical protein OSB04_022911 [Centaurea solstitialis]